MRSGTVLVALVAGALAALAPAALAQSSDIAVTKTAPSTAVPGSTLTYGISVTNLGPNDSAAVILTDNLPAGLTFVSLTSPAAFTCSTPAAGSGGTVSCTSGTFVAGTTANFTLVVQVPNGASPGTFFTNIATVSSETPDPNSENDSSTAVSQTPPPPQADLVVTKNGPVSAGANTNVTYSITLTNVGPDAASSLALSDTLPGTMTFVSLTQNSGPSLTCSTPAVGSGGTISCSAASFAAGATATFTLVGHIPGTATSGTTYVNTATASSTAADPNTNNNSSSAFTTVAAADLSITKSATPTATAGATTVIYTITLQNGGPDAADNVQFADALPAGLTFQSVVQNSGPTATCVTPAVGSGGTVACTISQMGSGSTASFTIDANVGASVPAGTVTNTATVQSDTADPNGSNNSASASTVVSTSADLSITKSGPATAVAGTTVTYTINLANAGPSDAVSVAMSDAIAAPASFVSLVQNSGPAFTCSAPAAGATGTISCTAPLFAAGATASFTLVVGISPAASGTMANTASISSGTPDPNLTNNTATSSAALSVSADVFMTKSGPASAGAGNPISYTLAAGNNGPSNAAGFSLTDAIPAGTTFVSLTQTAGPALTCTTPAVGGTGSINCSAASFAAGATATFTLVVQTSPTATIGSTITNTATVSTTTFDPTEADNTGRVTTTVGPGTADVSVTKAIAPLLQLYPGNSDVTFTIVVTNGGPAPATGVTLTDALPAAMTLVSTTASQGGCTGTSTITCSVGDLAVGASATYTIAAHIGSTLGSATNTATVSSGNTDPNPANNSASVTITVVADIPALSPLALLLMGAALALAGALLARRM